MQFPKKRASAPPRFKPLPRPGRFDSILLAVPAAVGLYGAPSDTVYLTTNHRPTLLQQVEAQPGSTVVAVEAGGFSPRLAEAFGVSAQEVQKLLRQATLKDEDDSLKHAYLTGTLANALGWQDGETQAGTIIHVTRAIVATKLRRSLANLGIRLAASLYLWLGQALLFLIPLLIWGWQVLFTGLACLLASAIGLALLWKVPIQRAGLKGGMVGILLSGAGVGLYAALSPGNPGDELRIAILLFISSIWMASVFMGLKNKFD